MKVKVMVFASFASALEWVVNTEDKPLVDYVMDHDDQAQRRVLGEQCRNAFEAGQCVVTFRV